jgi:hypothetical protein
MGSDKVFASGVHVCSKKDGVVYASAACSRPSTPIRIGTAKCEAILDSAADLVLVGIDHFRKYQRNGGKSSRFKSKTLKEVLVANNHTVPCSTYFRETLVISTSSSPIVVKDVKFYIVEGPWHEVLIGSPVLNKLGLLPSTNLTHLAGKILSMNDVSVASVVCAQYVGAVALHSGDTKLEVGVKDISKNGSRQEILLERPKISSFVGGFEEDYVYKECMELLKQIIKWRGLDETSGMLRKDIEELMHA